MALLMVGAAASPGFAAAPRPLPRQWWFGIWDVEKSLWPHGTGRGITVGLIDTGVQASIPELSGAVLPGRDFETGGDGRTDNNASFEGPGHGTRMATLIAAQGGGTGFAGVAPGAKILPLVAQRSETVAQAVRYAADQGAKVINSSQTAPGPCPADLQEAVSHALRKNVLVVAAAGNDGNGSNTSFHPANCAGVISVGAADVDTKPWEKTQRQPYVKVAGPGVAAGSVSSDGQYRPYYNGTSQASALTAAVVALIRSKYPSMSNREVARLLVASAKDIGPPGKDDLTGYGFTRPWRIFDGLIPKNTPNPVFEEYDRWASTYKGEVDPKDVSSSRPSEKSGADMPMVIAFASVLGIVVLAIVFALVKTRKGRSQPLGAGAVGAVPGAPPSFGGPFPPQGPPSGPPHSPPHGFGGQPPVSGQQPSPQAPFGQRPPQQGPGQGMPRVPPQVPLHGEYPPQPRTQQDIPKQPPPE